MKVCMQPGTQSYFRGHIHVCTRALLFHAYSLLRPRSPLPLPRISTIRRHRRIDVQERLRSELACSGSRARRSKGGWACQLEGG